MTSIARKNLFSDKTKFVTSVGGVAFSILVILAPFSVYYGSLLPAKALPLESGANLWVAQEGSGDLFHTVSLLPAGYEKKLEQIDGVSSASSIITHATRIEVGEKQVTAAVLGFDPQAAVGGPWEIYEGDMDPKGSEVVVDRSLASANSISVGDKINIAKEEFTVSGISLETNVLVFQYVFMNKNDAARIFQQENAVNYYLLEVGQENINEVREKTSDIVPGSIIKTKEDIAESNAAVIRDSFLPVLSILAFVGLMVGITIIGITIYSATNDRAREYGVLKAIGVRNGKLYRIVFEQAFISSILGMISGVLLYFAIQQIAFIYLPAVNFELPLSIYAYTAVSAILMGTVSSFIPVRKINSIDPAQVFKI